MVENIGIGTDIEQVSRFENVNGAFLNKIFTDRELNYCFSKKNFAQHLATRFAGKESIIKALYSIGQKFLEYKKIEIINNKEGVPLVVLSDPDLSVKISLSHCQDKAVAMAIIVKK